MLTHWAMIAPHGVGCHGVSLAPAAGSRPLLGTTLRSEITGAPSSPTNPVFLAIGRGTSSFGGRPLPLELTGLGSPGCFLYHDVVFGLWHSFTRLSETMAYHDLALPDDLSLVGQMLQLQAWTPIASGLASSNALVLVAGVH